MTKKDQKLFENNLHKILNKLLIKILNIYINMHIDIIFLEQN